MMMWCWVLCVVQIALSWTLDTTTTRKTFVATQLNTYNAGLTSALRNEKYDAMAVDAFAFFRGSNHLYWKDLGVSSDVNTFGGLSTTRCWLSGDAHITNIGAFENDNQNVVYDLNDFDESLIADYQLDVWRMATSIWVMMKVQNIGSGSDRSAVIDTFVEEYLDKIEDFKLDNSEVSLLVSAASTASDSKSFLSNFLADTESKESRTKLLAKYTVVTNSVRMFQTSNVDLAAVTSTEKSAVLASMASYGSSLSGGIAYSTSRFAVKDVAQRLHAGIGSLGTKRYYVLIEGATTSNSDDIILDFKAQTSPSAYLNVHATSISLTNSAVNSHHGKRMIQGYKSLAYKADDYLGFTLLANTQYSVRERNAKKNSFDTTVLNSVSDCTYMAEKWGRILATAHARSDIDASGSTIAHNFDSSVFALINGKHSNFRAKVHQVVDAYQDQVFQDHATFVAYRANGQISSATAAEDTVTSNSDVDVGAIVGGVLGGFGVAILLIAAVIRSRRQQRGKTVLVQSGSWATPTPFSSKKKPVAPAEVSDEVVSTENPHFVDEGKTSA